MSTCIFVVIHFCISLLKYFQTVELDYVTIRLPLATIIRFKPIATSSTWGSLCLPLSQMSVFAFQLSLLLLLSTYTYIFLHKFEIFKQRYKWPCLIVKFDCCNYDLVNKIVQVFGAKIVFAYLTWVELCNHGTGAIYISLLGGDIISIYVKLDKSKVLCIETISH